MAVQLSYTARPQGNPNYVVPEGVSIQFNTNLGQGQIDAGVAAKVNIVHPAFTTRATMFKNRNGRAGYHVRSSSIDIGKDGNKNFFNIVQLDDDFRNHIVNEFKKFLENSGEERAAWYLPMLGEHTHTSTVTIEEANESLGVTEILLNTELTTNQVESGMVAKVTVKTTVGDLRGYSVYRSRYGESLYGIAQNEDEENQIPAYRLSREAEAQVLNFIHAQVTDWGEAPTPRQRPVVATIPAGTIAGAADGQTAGAESAVAGAVVTNEADVYND